jgi:hypothetical protein
MIILNPNLNLSPRLDLSSSSNLLLFSCNTKSNLAMTVSNPNSSPNLFFHFFECTCWAIFFMPKIRSTMANPSSNSNYFLVFFLYLLSYFWWEFLSHGCSKPKLMLEFFFYSHQTTLGTESCFAMAIQNSNSSSNCFFILKIFIHPSSNSWWWELFGYGHSKPKFMLKFFSRFFCAPPWSTFNIKSCLTMSFFFALAKQFLTPITLPEKIRVAIRFENQT